MNDCRHAQCLGGKLRQKKKAVKKSRNKKRKRSGKVVEQDYCYVCGAQGDMIL